MYIIIAGCGKIGANLVKKLSNDGHDVVVIDNLSNSSREAIKRVEEISGKSVEFHEADVRNREALDTIFAAGDIDAVIHFAGLKAVGESVEKPLMYYENNIDSTLVLIEAMQASGV